MAIGRAKSLSEQALMESAYLLAPLRHLDSAPGIIGLMRDLGWQLPSADLFENGFPDSVASATSLIETVFRISGDVTEEDYLSILKDVMSGIESVVNLMLKAEGLRADINAELSAFPDFVNQSGIATEEFPKRLLDYLVTLYLNSRQPRVFGLCNLLGIIEEREIVSSSEYEPPGSYVLKVVHWDRISKLVSDPGSLAEVVYQWSTDFNSGLFLARVQAMLRSLLIPCGLYKQDAIVSGGINSSDSDDLELRIPILQGGEWPDSYLEAGINISPLVAAPPKKKGIAFIPYLLGLADLSGDVSDNWEFSTKGSLRLDSGLGLLIRPPHDLQLDLSLFDSPQKGVDGRIELNVSRKKYDDSLYLVFGTQKGSRLGFKNAGIGLIAEKKGDEQEFSGEVSIGGFTIVIDTSDGDGFLQKILSGIKVESVADLSIGISNKDGFYFRGSGALELVIPIHKVVGPVNLESIYVSIIVSDGFEVQLAATLGAQLGPITASVNRIGLRIPIEIRSDGRGNLGPVNVSAPKFMPPTGAGLSIAAGPIVGGGFLDFDPDSERYDGILTLQLGEIGLVAIGLITTRLPDGSKGFSLLVNIGVTFNPPIQLSFGFTLQGVGGLIGINRSMDIELLQRGIRNRTLDSILFPDPATVIANASQIISDMRAVFPVTEGRFVVGPMVKIGWGSPTLITADVGIFLELPEPVRVVLMGKVQALLPEANQPKVVIKLNVLGVLDVEKQELTFQASLYDSRILTYPITGDSAFLLNWGANPQFALSLGGFHPKFTPPSPPIVFADLTRLTIDISSGKNLQLTCKAYQAVTPNSVQFGARVELYAAAGGATLRGHLGFDALFYLSPFSFEVRVEAGVGVRYKGVSLAHVDLNFRLSGPTPWNARGQVKFKALGVTVKKKFNFTWGNHEPAPLPARDPWPELQAALAAPANWGTTLPAGRGLVEALRSTENEVSTGIVVHPVGRFEVRQNVAPLAVNLQKAGSAPITGHDRFDIQKLTVGGEVLQVTAVQEFFSRGQHEDLSADKKLSVPAFEKMKGGVTSAASAAVRVDGTVERRELAYESIVIKADRTSVVHEAKGDYDWEDAQLLVAAEATRAAVERAGPAKRFAAPAKRQKVRVKDDRYAIVNAADLTRAVLASSIMQEIGRNASLSRVDAEQVLKRHLDLRPGDADLLIVVPEYEVYLEAA